MAVATFQRMGVDQFNDLSNSEKKKYLDQYPNSSHANLIGKATESAKAVFKAMYSEIETMSAHLKAPKKEIKEALSEPSVLNILRATGSGVKGISKACLAALKVPNAALLQTFKEAEKAGVFKKLNKGTQSVDKFLKKYPLIKKVGGPLVAGALVYQWLNMSFSGDLDDDFDIDAVGQALAGEYSIEDLLGKPAGIKAMTQLIAGIATGGALSFPWHNKMTIGFAAVYTGAKKAGNTKLAKKAQDKLKQIFSKKNQSKSLNQGNTMEISIRQARQVSESAGKKLLKTRGPYKVKSAMWLVNFGSDNKIDLSDADNEELYTKLNKLSLGLEYIGLEGSGLTNVNIYGARPNLIKFIKSEFGDDAGMVRDHLADIEKA